MEGNGTCGHAMQGNNTPSENDGSNSAPSAVKSISNHSGQNMLVIMGPVVMLQTKIQPQSIPLLTLANIQNGSCHQCTENYKEKLSRDCSKQADGNRGKCEKETATDNVAEHTAPSSHDLDNILSSPEDEKFDSENDASHERARLCHEHHPVGDNISRESEQSEGSAIRQRDRRPGWKKILKVIPRYIVVLLIGLGIGGGLGTSLGYKYAPKAPTTNTHEAAGQAAQLGLTLDIPLDMRIPVTMECTDRHKCRSCTMPVTQQSDSFQSNDQSMERHHNMVNGTCFNCSGTCKTIEDIQNNRNGRLKCGRRTETIKCKHISSMANDSSYCNGGTSVCLTPGVSDHRCKCPAGKSGATCNETLPSVNIQCKCFNLPNSLCDDNMPDCSTAVFNQSDHCQHRLLTGENCVCNNNQSLEDADESECVRPPQPTVSHQKSQQSSASTLISPFWLSLIAVFGYRCILWETYT